MATNKFVTMFHRDTNNKIIVILVDAFLEWILISLLLLNSLFSYLITKFAKWVGLQPPCLWCSRIDHILQPEKGTTLQKDLVCETHAAEISNLSYCSNHQKLAETQSMCEDCFASRPTHDDGRNSSFGMRQRNIGFMVSQEKHENGEKITNKCSCCNESIRRCHLYPPPYLQLKPSWGEGNYASKGSLIVESIDDEKEGDDRDSGENHTLSDIESFILMEVGEDHSSSVSNLHSNEKGVEKDEILEDDLTIIELDPTHPIGANNFISHFSETSSKASIWEDRSIEVINMACKSYVPCDIPRLIPIKLIDSITSLSFESCKINEDLGDREQKIEAALLMKNKNEEKASMRELESLTSSTFQEVEELKQDSEVEGHPQRIIASEEAGTSLNGDCSVKEATEEPDNTHGCLNESTQEDECSTSEESSTSDDDMGVQDAFDAFIAHNNLSKSQSLSYNDNNIEATMEKPDTPRANLPPLEEPEDQSSTSEDDTEVSNAFNEFISQNNLCPHKTDENDKDSAEKRSEKTISVETNHNETSHESSKFSETYEAEEDKLPETPRTVDGKLMLFEKRETAAEDSIDGSVASEVEYSDPALTIERLKTALNSERKASSSIYQELEEERSASAVAANQTMAMITRLQEEKAAMKMEALQYQRMMEEQAEYDQEALQLLNELMVKKEKEKQELEKELEEYKQKVMAYEAKEKLRLLRRMKDGGSVRSRDSSSSYELSIDDLNRETREDDEDCFFNKEESSNNHTNGDTVSNLEEMALDCVKHISALDNSLVEFEEERASILDQLKALEEKIISLGGNEEFLDEIKLIENSSQYGDNDLNDNCNSNVFSYEEDKHSPRRTMGSLAKRLLPYLDEAGDENEEAYNFEKQLESESVDMKYSVPTIEEEVDRVYERLQALGTDQEFLQHCMGSIQNGDKGMDLLQEILQHLHDLKAVESRLKNLGNE